MWDVGSHSTYTLWYTVYAYVYIYRERDNQKKKQQQQQQQQQKIIIVLARICYMFKLKKKIIY